MLDIARKDGNHDTRLLIAIQEETTHTTIDTKEMKQIGDYLFAQDDESVLLGVKLVLVLFQSVYEGDR